MHARRFPRPALLAIAALAGAAAVAACGERAAPSAAMSDTIALPPSQTAAVDMAAPPSVASRAIEAKASGAAGPARNALASTAPGTAAGAQDPVGGAANAAAMIIRTGFA